MQYFILIVIVLLCSYLSFRMGVTSTITALMSVDEETTKRLFKELKEKNERQS